MNLYEIRFRHYAPKDSAEGVACYLLAASDEDVFKWFCSEPKITQEITLYNSWGEKSSDENDEEYEQEYYEEFCKRIIKCKGDMHDDESEVYDLYYGATQFGWCLIHEDVKNKDTDIIEKYGIRLCRL